MDDARKSKQQLIDELVSLRQVVARLEQHPSPAERTQRETIEPQLLESEERYRNLVETTQELIWTCNDRGEFVYLNPAWEQTHGYKIEEMLGRPFSDFQPPDIAERDRAEFGSHLTGGSVRHYETTHIAKDGRELTLLFNAIPLRDGAGNIVGAQGTATDITDRMRADEENAGLQAQLAHAQKLESVGRLAGGVAHDFNNMLGVILGHTEMALEQVGAVHPLHADLVEIQKAATRSAELTRQLLGFARRQTIVPRVLDLNATVDGMLKMLRRLIGEDIALEWSPGGDLPKVKIDPSQVSQILANLSVNAHDAIHGAGKLTVSTSTATFDAAYYADHEECTPGRYLMLAVSDTGRGMSREVMAHVFEPFFTTKALGEGAGLGLATVYGIVRQNGGFIDVDSTPGQGTTFRIYLPEYTGKTVRGTDDSEAGAARRGVTTVMLVEDEPAMLNVTKRMLERLGYEVLAAASPAEAIKLAEEHPDDIQLLIADVVMPEMNGRDLAKRLLSLYPNIKRILMSGYAADVITDHGVVEDGVHFLQKPFSSNVLATRIRDVLDNSVDSRNA